MLNITLTAVYIVELRGLYAVMDINAETISCITKKWALYPETASQYIIVAVALR